MYVISDGMEREGGHVGGCLNLAAEGGVRTDAQR